MVQRIEELEDLTNELKTGSNVAMVTDLKSTLGIQSNEIYSLKEQILAMKEHRYCKASDLFE